MKIAGVSCKCRIKVSRWKTQAQRGEGKATFEGSNSARGGGEGAVKVTELLQDARKQIEKEKQQQALLTASVISEGGKCH